jgi:hypothetical protein
MNFFDYALRDIPTNLYKRSGNVFTNIAIPSGSSTATITAFGPALVAGGGGSISIGLGATRKYAFAESNFQGGNEARAFTLLAVVNPVLVTQELSVWSHATSGSVVDGISIDADNVVFRVKFVAGDVVAKWEFPDFTEAYVVHGVYTPNAIKLFINGELKTVTEIPDGYVASGFIGTGGTIYSGYVSAANDKALVDAFGSYPYALTDDKIAAHSIAARDTIPMQINVASLGGFAIDGSQRRILDQKVFNGVVGWDSIAATDTSVIGGELVPQVDQTTALSKPGTWTGMYVIDNDTISSIAGIKAEWNGNGSFSVQSSLDGGSTYQTVTNGELIPTSQGLNPAGKTLLIKITFTGGVANDVAEVRDLTLTSYQDNYIYTSNNDARKLQISGSGTATTLSKNEPIEYSSRPGIHQTGSTITMQQDTDESPISIQALEFLVTPKGVTSGAGGYLFDTRPYGGTAYMWIPEATGFWQWTGASAVYINGVAATSGSVTAVKNEQTHILFTFPAAFNTKIDVAGGLQIAEYNLISAYPTAPTDAQALQLFANYTSYPVASFTEAGVVQVIEPASPYVLTVADWASLPQQ